MTTLSGKSQVEYFRLASVKQQLKLEKLGLRSSGGAIRPRLAEEFGLSPRASRDEYIRVCQERMDRLIETVRQAH